MMDAEKRFRLQKNIEEMIAGIMLGACSFFSFLAGAFMAYMAFITQNDVFTYLIMPFFFTSIFLGYLYFKTFENSKREAYNLIAKEQYEKEAIAKLQERQFLSKVVRK